MLNKIIRPLHILEDSALVLLVAALVVMGAAQIIMRNLGISGMIWMDSASRVAVLWLAMFGALRASREQKHIVIDLLSHYANPLLRRISFFIVSVCSAIICLIAAGYSYQFIRGEMEYGGTAFLAVPEWLCQAIIPVALLLIALRSLIHSLHPPEQQHDNA